MIEGNSLVVIDGGRPIWVVAFSTDGEHLVSGDDEAIRVWRVADGNLLGTMAAYDVRSIAVSSDGRQLAAGTELGRVSVWDTRTYAKIFTHKESGTVRAVDFSPDSTHLVSASGNCTASIWDLAMHKQVLGPLHHGHGVVAAKFSPQGDRVATYAEPGSARVYDSRSGQLLVDIPIILAIYCNIGLTWSNDGGHLFAVSDGKIKQLQASTGIAVSEWRVHEYKGYACISLSKHGNFMAWSSNRSVMFWDISMGTQLGHVIQHDQDVHSVALSSNDQLFATSTGDGRIIIRSLHDILTSFSGPFIHIDAAIFESWKQGRLAETQALLTEEIDSEKPSRRALAYRALVRTRLGQWDAAISDAKKSLDIQLSVIGFIAKSVALVGQGKRQEGYRTYDLAFKFCPPDRVDTFLAIKAVVVCMTGEYADAISRMDDLIATISDNTMFHTLQAYMYLLCGNSQSERGDHEGAIESFERAQTQLRSHASRPLWTISLISGWRFDDLDITIQQRLCDALYSAGRVRQAEDVLLKVANNVAHLANVAEPLSEWVTTSIQRCLSTGGSEGDLISEDDRNPSTGMLLLAEWVRIKLANLPWRDVLAATAHFTTPRNMVYRVICGCLEVTTRLTDAADCCSQVQDDPTITQNDIHWVPDFKRRCSRKLEDLGDSAMDARRYGEAISLYSDALTLNPTTTRSGLLAKRSTAYVAHRSPKEALNDANEIINLDPSSPVGYETRHMVLRGERRYTDAIEAFREMLMMISQSPDPATRDRFHQYVKPEQTEAMIRHAVQDTIRDLPRVLINTVSGHLLNKSKQAILFESSPVFMELVSSMTTYIDNTRIEHEVAQYYRYAMLSDTWEEGPLAANVAHAVVYDLEEPFGHDKLRMLCKIARGAGLDWAWSFSCCVDKQDHAALQEAVVAMFRWYEASSLTVVFLRGVRSPSKHGDLSRSIWNTEAWALQAYLASKVIWFYTEDWKPYLDLTLANHKESAEIISEMEEVTGISAQTLAALRPGLIDIREKLALASRRETTQIEDVAYSLFGIFSISLPVVYGEGDKALGRLLAHLLSHSGDTSILAWTGKPSSFNTCLPADISVFSQLATSHIPSASVQTTMERIAAKLYPSSQNLLAASRLYDQLGTLPLPSVSGKRIRIPSITFRLGHLRHISECTFRANTDVLGIVEVTTSDDLPHMDTLYIVHPWIDFLLDRRPVRDSGDVPAYGDSSPDWFMSHDTSSLSADSNIALVGQRMPISGVVTRLWQSFGPFPAKFPLRSATQPVSQADKRMQTHRFIARLRQPFGALMICPTGLNVAEYRRVASDGVITVQIQQDAPLDSLLPNVRMLDII